MNERIHDLGRKATEWCVSQFNPGDDFDAMWEEKFAELIVKQCASIADTDDRNPAGCGYVTKTKGMLIKEYFGVEE